MARPVKYTFDPFEITGREKPKGSKRVEALNDISDFLKVEILDRVSSGNSPISGYGKFPKLTKPYADRYKRGDRTPNLELTGDMLGALDVSIKGNRVTVSIGGSEAAKADGHNNHSGQSALPLRRFIPDAKEFFKKDIENGIKRIIDEYNDD